MRIKSPGEGALNIWQNDIYTVIAKITRLVT